MRTLPYSLLACMALGVPVSLPLYAQQVLDAPGLRLTSALVASLPNAPLPNGARSVDETDRGAPPAIWSSSQTTTPQTTTPTSPAAQTSAADQQPETEAQRRAKAAEELKLEESQRIGGIIPNFNAVNNGKAEPISPGQKFQLFLHGSVDPYQFALAGLDALIGQAEGDPKGYMGGVKGFLRRYGANYGDNFDGNFWGNAVLPSLLHQDPRYFRMGHGKVLHRAFYSISTTFRCKGDNGKWEPNVSNITGNLIGASISNLYYPDYPNERGLYPTLRRGLSVTYQGTAGALLEEFYPDISSAYKRHHARRLAEKQAGATQAVQH